jgi:hypothetical protein
VFHAAANHECVSCLNVERGALARNPQTTGHDINNLVVRVAVHLTNPTFYPLFGLMVRDMVSSARQPASIDCKNVPVNVVTGR